MADKKPTIGDVLDKLGITFSDWRTIKSDIEFSMRNREIVLCGGDWQEHQCGECGYWAEVNRLIANGKVYGSTNTYFEKISGCKNGDRGSRCQACPDYIPREVTE